MLLDGCHTLRVWRNCMRPAGHYSVVPQSASEKQNGFGTAKIGVQWGGTAASCELLWRGGVIVVQLPHTIPGHCKMY